MIIKKKLKLNIQLFAQSDAEVKFKVVLDDNNASKQLDDLGNKGSKVTTAFNKISSVGKSVFKGLAIGIGTATTALGGLVAKSVQMAGELEQQMGGTEAVFKEYAETVQEMSKKAYSSAGLSANDYMATMNKMGALMQGSGIDIKTSMDLSSQAMQRAADVASIMGIDIDMAMESIAGAAKGNMTMMDNLGVAMNATTIEAYALSKGVKKSYDSMTKAEQVQYAMEMFLEKTTYAMGNYTKENQTFAGSLQTMKAAISNFMSGAGDIQPVIESVLSFGKILVKSIGEMAPQIVTGIIDLINGIAPQLPQLLQQLLPAVIDGAVSLVNGLVQVLPTIIPILMQGIVQAFSGIVEILPDILDALLKGAIFIIQALAEQMPVLIPQIIDAILAMIPILIDNAPLFIKAGFQLLIGLLQGLIEAVPTLLKYIPKIIVSIVNYFKQIPSLMKGIGKNLVEGLWNGIKNVKNWVLDKIKGFGKSILSGIKSIFGINSPSKVMFEIGGYLDKGFINGIEDMETDIDKQLDSTFGSGLDYLYNGYSNFASGVPNTSYTNVPSQMIYLNNNNSNSSVLQVDGRVLAETVNTYNYEREVAV